MAGWRKTDVRDGREEKEGRRDGRVEKEGMDGGERKAAAMAMTRTVQEARVARVLGVGRRCRGRGGVPLPSAVVALAGRPVPAIIITRTRHPVRVAAGLC